jgi:superfamily II RNA helicase
MVFLNSVDLNDSKYKEWYDTFPYTLSLFQKTSIQSIINGHHSLVCVPTGSGKTAPALFVIEYFKKRGKKVVYTSPIKALSNQKFHEFREKFPNISIGILTGDIKLNPHADVLIMTAEILQNKFISKHSIDFDIESEVGCIIHDEVHMINDRDRGHVWEQLIMKCPKNVQMLLLSATLHDPISFASWIESVSQRKVVVSSHNERMVPLYHLGYMTYNSTLVKRVKDAELQFLENFSHNFKPLYQSNGKFNSENFNSYRKCLKIMEKKNYHVNHVFCIQSLIDKLSEENMLPAVCFILSKKQIEYYAKTISVNLFPKDSKIPPTMKKICESILRKKFPNCEEFFKLEEFTEAIKMFERGIAIHHSSMIPVLRELTEILFEQGYLKFLFATETFSVGLNMPIRTTVFTDIYKFDGNKKRLFFPHEFIQSSGRAGRRGIDEKGYVIHLLNMYNPDIIETEYRNMIMGASPPIKSQFKFSYHLFFFENDITEFYNGSLDDNEKLESLQLEESKLIDFDKKINAMKSKTLTTPPDIIEKYKSLSKHKSSKKAKKNRHQQQLLEEDYTSLLEDLNSIDRIKKLQSVYETEKESFLLKKNSTNVCLRLLRDRLIQYEFLDSSGMITPKGIMASKIHLIPCLPCIHLIDDVRALDSKQLVALFSVLFPHRYVEHDDRSTLEVYPLLHSLVVKFEKLHHDFESFEMTLNTGEIYCISCKFFQHCMNWMECENQNDCLLFLSSLRKTTGIYVGEFFKLMLNINNLIDEFSSVAEIMGDMTFLHELKTAKTKTLKFVITNQSLYV